MAGGKQPVEFLLVEWTVKPAQRQMRRPRKRNLAERDSQRKFKGRAGMPQEGALDFATARAGGQCDNQQACVRLSRELTTAPDRASCQLGLGIGCGVETDLFGWLAFGSFLPRAPGCEEAALHGQNAIKSGQKQRRTLCCVSFEQRNQLVWQADGANQTFRPACLVKGRQPAAEGRRILLPGNAGRRPQKLWHIRTKQIVSLYGQCCHAMARALQQSSQIAVQPGDLYPERLFLRGIEHEAGIGGTLLPGDADKALPVENLRRGPGGQTFGLTGAMEGIGKGASSAVAGRDHQAALAQPRIDLCCQDPHFSVIRCQARDVPFEGAKGRQSFSGDTQMSYCRS